MVTAQLNLETTVWSSLSAAAATAPAFTVTDFFRSEKPLSYSLWNLSSLIQITGTKVQVIAAVFPLELPCCFTLVQLCKVFSI